MLARSYKPACLYIIDYQKLIIPALLLAAAGP